MSIASILNIAKTAISASQVSLQVASNNVANANTAGYTRQEAVLTEAPSTRISNVMIGNGVSVESVIRHYDEYLEKAISNKNVDLEEQKTLQSFFERIEALLEEDNSNLSSSIDTFFSGWQELSLEPTSVPARTTVVASGENLSRGIRNIYNELEKLQIEADNIIGIEINNVNKMLSSITSLNQQIMESSNVGNDGAANLLDKVTELLKELSGEINIQYVGDRYGRVTVMTDGGSILVDGNKCYNLKTADDESTGFNKITWEDQAGNLLDITGKISGGKLKALLDIRDNYIGDGFLNDMNELAKSIITETNAIHKNGFNLNGTKGISFFDDVEAYFAKNMDVNNQIKNNVSNVAATSSILKPTDNDIAMSIASLVNKKVTINGSQSTFTDYVSSIESNIGVLAKNAETLLEYQQNTMDTLVSQRESISGVSIDEEMANLLKYQYAYQAAARLYNVTDSLFQAILNTVS